MSALAGILLLSLTHMAFSSEQGEAMDGIGVSGILKWKGSDSTQAPIFSLAHAVPSLKSTVGSSLCCHLEYCPYALSAAGRTAESGLPLQLLSPLSSSAALSHPSLSALLLASSWELLPVHREPQMSQDGEQSQ